MRISQKKIKRIKKIGICAVAALLCICSVLLSSCAKGYRFGADEQGRTVNKKTGTAYNVAPACYQPIAVTEELYGSGDENTYYALAGVDPAQWLYGELGVLLYADGVTLPTLEQMNIGEIEMKENDITLSDRIMDASVIGEIISQYTSGENLTYLGGQAAVNIVLRLLDRERGICYEINYLVYEPEDETENGVGGEQGVTKNAFFYCRSEKRFVAVSESLRAYMESYHAA